MSEAVDGSLVFDTELDNEGFKRGSEKLLSSVEGLSGQINNLGNNMKDAFSGLMSIMQSTNAAILQMQTNSGNGATQAAGTAQQVAAANEQVATSSERANRAVKSYDKELARLQKELDAAKKQLSDYYKSYQELEEFTNEALRHTDSDAEAASIVETEQYGIEQLNEKYADKLAILQRLEEQYARVAAARDAAAGQTTATAEPTQPPPAAPDSGEVDTATSSYNRLRAAVNEAGNAAIRAGIYFARIGFNAIAKACGNLITKLKRLSSQSRKTTLTNNGLVKSLTSLKRLLITRIKRMFISAIFNDVRGGLKSLAEFSSEFNTTMSGIKNSAKQISGGVSVAIGNLITAVEPVLMRIIDAVTNAINSINMLFALLSGKSTYTAAKKGTEDYAKGVDSAVASQKELNAELYGFDELTRQSKQDTSGGAEAGGIEYEEREIDLPDGVSDWAERLKEAFKNQDWYGVGSIIGEGINAAIDRVDDWFNNTLRPKGVEWASRLATVLNGLTDGINWPKLGKTVADGLNAIVDICNTFMYGYDWHNLGTRLGEAINGFVYNAEWENLGAFFASKWHALINTIHGIVHETDWGALGSGIGTAIYSWFSNIDWVMLADSIVTGFNGLVLMLSNAIATIDWSTVGTTLAESLETLIKGINWENLGVLLSNAVVALLNLITNFIANFDWFGVSESLVKGLCTAVANINWLQVLATLGAGLISLIAGMKLQLLGLISGLSQSLADAFSAIGADGIAGFFQGISDALSNVASWIKEHIVDPVVNGVKDFFGIHSPSTVFAEIGENLVAGLLDGLSRAWEDIKSFFSTSLENLKNSFSEAWDNIKTRTSTTWNNIKSNVTNTFTSTKNSLVTTANGLKSSLITAFSTLSTNVQTKWSGLKTALKNVEWGSIGRNLVEGLKNGIVNAWTGLTSKIHELASGLTTKVKNLLGIHSPSTVFEKIGMFLTAGLGQGIEKGKQNVLVIAAKTANDVTQGLTPDAATVDVSADRVVTGMQAVISGLGSLANIFKIIADTLTATGGLVTPQIAAGTVVPYKTRVDGSTLPEVNSDGTESRLIEIAAQLQALIEMLQRSGSEPTRETKIIIDGREVFSAVVDQNEQAIQRTGRSPLRT